MEQTIVENTISYRLNHALQMRRLSPTELSRLSGIPFSSICGYLSGKYQPKVKTLILFADSLGTSVKWLAGITPLEGINDTTGDGNDPSEQLLLEDYRNLNPDGKKLLLSLTHAATENFCFVSENASDDVKDDTTELPAINNLSLEDDIECLKTQSIPDKNIVVLGGLTGILSDLDEKYGIESDWDRHLSVKNDIFGQYIYWKPIDIYIQLTREYTRRIRPRIKSENPDTAGKIDSVLANLLEAVEFVSDKPVFPNLFSPRHRNVFISSYYIYREKFELFLRNKIPELN